MSIASEARSEATKRLHKGRMAEEWPDDTFVDGAVWQASRPVTEEEIEAAAKAMYEATFGPDEPVFGWEQTQSIYRKKARLALSAARKQVTQ